MLTQTMSWLLLAGAECCFLAAFVRYIDAEYLEGWVWTMLGLSLVSWT
jgi:hypothetical protein